MNNPVLKEVKPQQNNAIPQNNANPQINLVANLQINQNPIPNQNPVVNEVMNPPVAVPITDVNQLKQQQQQQYVPIIDNAIPITNSINSSQEAVPLSEEPEYETEEPEYEVEEPEYDTGHEYMDLQEELDFDEDDENNKPNLETIPLCLYRIRTDLKTPFLEFLVERTDENPQFHLPLYTADNTEDVSEDNTTLQNNLLRKIEILFNNDETLEIPRFLGFQRNSVSSPVSTEQIVAFYDLTQYSFSELSEKDGSIQWVILNQITEENGFHPETIDFFQENIYIRTLYHIPTQEEVPPPVLVYHSFKTPTRTDDPVFGFPFVFTEKPIYPVDFSSDSNNNEKQPVENPETNILNSTTEKQPVVKKDDKNPEEPPIEPIKEKNITDDDKKTQTNLFSTINPLSTTNRSYPYILFPPSLEKTFVILKQEYQNIPPELLKKYSDVFLKKICIRFLKDKVDYWIVKSPVVAFPYTPFQPFKEKKTVSLYSTASKVSFLPGKTTSSIFTTPSKKTPVVKGKTGISSFRLNIENLLNPHRMTERANMLKRR